MDSEGEHDEEGVGSVHDGSEGQEHTSNVKERLVQDHLRPGAGPGMKKDVPYSLGKAGKPGNNRLGGPSESHKHSGGVMFRAKKDVQPPPRPKAAAPDAASGK